jgi:hypothetical protein
MKTCPTTAGLTAYNAALQAAKMAMACAGYRLASTPSHHRLTVEAARRALRIFGARLARFFPSVPAERKVIGCDYASVVTHTETEEIIAKTKDFVALVERWIASNHPKLILLTLRCGEFRGFSRCFVYPLAIFCNAATIFPGFLPRLR